MKRRSYAGFALVNAIFLIVVLGGLAAVAATLARSSADTSVRSLQAAKVYFGAQAGLDWAIQRVIATTTGGEAACTAANTSFNLTQGGLNGISVTVTCETDRLGTVNATNVYYIVATATPTGVAAGAVNYAERRLEASVSNF